MDTYPNKFKLKVMLCATVKAVMVANSLEWKPDNNNNPNTNKR